MTADGGLPLEVRLLIVKLLADHLAGTRANDLVPEANAQWRPKARIPVVIGGQLAGWVSVTDPQPRAEVTDEKKLLAWARKYYPGEVEEEVVTTWTIRDSFVNAVKAEVLKFGGYVVKESDSLAGTPGDVVPVPGVEVKTGTPVVRTDPEAGAIAVVAAAMAAGEIDAGTVQRLALPPPEAGAGDDCGGGTPAPPA